MFIEFSFHNRNWNHFTESFEVLISGAFSVTICKSVHSSHDSVIVHLYKSQNLGNTERIFMTFDIGEFY